jgi:hypothetical protein
LPGLIRLREPAGPLAGSTQPIAVYLPILRVSWIASDLAAGNDHPPPIRVCVSAVS